MHVPTMYFKKENNDQTYIATTHRAAKPFRVAQLGCFHKPTVNVARSAFALFQVNQWDVPMKRESRVLRVLTRVGAFQWRFCVKY